jgi:hypothetical protein
MYQAKRKGGNDIVSAPAGGVATDTSVDEKGDRRMHDAFKVRNAISAAESTDITGSPLR